ncbi:hypothetical protein [Dyadobacter alkalitolerans]|uniref:hypothetical protein n=1 Tax=Dyadobacter alkalitolerans TaxID=492736 RepID=UPI0003F7D909|nr:hypothetical protein [Dyadobacter alkalitolerans]
MDFQAFCDVIHQNFVAPKTSGAKGKGLWQIVRQIDNLSDTDPELRQQLKVENQHRLSVYPIIIYGDQNFDISGVNRYVNDHFEPMIARHRTTLESVRPVTMINVNELIKYFALLKSKPNQLCILIDEYHAYLAKNRRKYDREGYLHDHYLSNRSFASYLQGKLKGDHFAINLSVMKKDFDLNIRTPE